MKYTLAKCCRNTDLRKLQWSKFFILAALLCPLCSISQQKELDHYSIAGNIKGLGSDSVCMLIAKQDKAGKRIADTIALKAVNDEFFYEGNTSHTKSIWGTVEGIKSRKSFTFFLEKGNIIIKGNVDDMENLSITGTPSNNDQTKARRYTHAIYNRNLELREKLKTATANSDEHKKISGEIAAKFDSIKAYEVAFVRANPQSYYSAILLWVKQDNLPLEELEELYNAFPLSIQKSDRGIDILNKIKARKFVAVGNPAPDFISTDTSGNKVKLSDFRGKYVLLEFWANWCVPCRAQHPHMVEMYKKYKDKGFTILQYSIDEQSAADKWKAAIIKDNLVWTQTSDLKGFESKVAKLYGVQPIPDNFLIDPDGKIIGRRLHGKELEEKLEALLN